MKSPATARRDSKNMPAAARRLLIACAVVFTALAASPRQSTADDFSVTDTDGKNHSLAASKGQWVLVNFWATWCPPCFEEIPEFAELYTAQKSKRLSIIGIAIDIDDKARVFALAEKLGMNYPLVLGDERVIAQFGKINVLPTTFLFDPKGKKVLHRVGPLSRKEIEKLIGM